MFDRLIRYLPVLDYIKKNKPACILEVGCSSQGIGEWWEGKFTGCDMDFPETPVKNMHAVVGSADKLPFPDKSFDFVFCLDVFEHLEEKIRGKASREMLRVSKGTVIISYPCGKGAKELSKKMLKWFEARNSGTARWMREHVEMGLPKEKFQIPSSKFQTISKTLKSQQFNNENLFVCELLLKLEEFPRVLKIEMFLFRHFRGVVEAILRMCSFKKCYRKIWAVRFF